MYVRHGKGARSFWECDIGGAVKKVFNLSLRSLLQDWSVAVYVPKVDVDFDNVRKTLLELQGGQTKIMCNDHNFPLVVSRIIVTIKVGTDALNHLAELIFVRNI